ncbi:hypothetical protein OEA41_007955 [Lepraria neglecta]|uniref:Uncharacterized protein n=1 Tax=Lepraria neglecta TaxID=209136 RepID=A0AAD9ZDU0_9LECA|nr:hypothetical protein OEA41_007955 [Lepraria neglecta]
MARAYQEAHIVENLASSMKLLQAQTTELAKLCGTHEERIKNLTTANAELVKKNATLETRMMANEHNNTARLQNSHLPPLSHTPLVPLHDLGTNRPIRHFPKHEKDIKIMSTAEVIQVLQALDIKTMGMSQVEKKQQLRAQTGLPGESITKAEGSGT